MSDAELRALVEQGPCVVQVSRDDMLRLLDERHALLSFYRATMAEWASNTMQTRAAAAAACDRVHRLLHAASARPAEGEG
jgi:hypothetical protein